MVFLEKKHVAVLLLLLLLLLALAERAAAFVPQLATAAPLGLSRTLDEVLSPPSVDPSPIYIKKATRPADLVACIGLRVKVFYTCFATCSAYQKAVVDKTRMRIERDGAVVLIANRNAPGGIARGNQFFGNCVSTVEFCSTVIENPNDVAAGRSATYLYDLCVRPDARRIGLGTRMVQAVEDYVKIKQGGTQNQVLYLHVDRTNPPAIDLYRKMGFVTVPDSDWSRHFTESRLEKDADSFFLMQKILGAMLIPTSSSTDFE